MNKNENFIVDGTATGINVPIFFYDLQQPTKKINNPDYFKTLEALTTKADFVISSNAKISIRKRTHKVNKQKKKRQTFCAKKNQAQRNQPTTYRGILRRRKWFRNLKGRQSKRRSTVSLSTNEKKLC